MATPNRGTRITKLLGQIKKHFKPVNPPPSRTLVEHLFFACLLENSPHEAAEEAFATLEQQYHGWNEVRVSTKRELAETLKGLVDPEDAAIRLKRTLHSVFESIFSFDLEHLKKKNLGEAAAQIEKYDGTTPYTVAYVTQHALGGHAIPVNKGLLIAFTTFDIINEAEAAKWAVPGLDRAVPKAKGIETASLLHQLGVETGRNPYGQSARKLLQAIDPNCKPRLPKKPEPPPPRSPEQPAEKKAAGSDKPTGKKRAAAKKAAGDEPAPAVQKKTTAADKPKPVTKKTAKQPTTGSLPTKKKKTATKSGEKITKRKPR